MPISEPKPKLLQFAFVDIDGSSSKPKATNDKSLVRSHCMRGKNKQEGSRRSVRQARKHLCVTDAVVSSADDAFVHCILLAAATVDDSIQQRLPGNATRFHLWHTLALLNEKLSDKEAYRVDSTVFIVLTLAFITDMFGDRAAMNAHIAGLGQILQMRGSIDTLRHSPKIHFKIGRLDLAWFLRTGEVPRLLSVPVPVLWDSLYGNQPKLVVDLDDGFSSGGDMDLQSFIAGFLGVRLATVFHDLQQLTRLINHHTQNNTRLEGEEFQEAVCSIQLRLLHLKDSNNGGNVNCNDNEDVAAECLRLSMLAFLSTTFQVPGRRSRPVYLTEQMRSACQRIEPSTPELRVLVFWSLIVGVISVLDVDEPWLRCKWDFLTGSGLSWERSLERLQSVMWITSIQDDLGKKAYSELMSRDLSQSVNLEAGLSSDLNISP